MTSKKLKQYAKYVKHDARVPNSVSDCIDGGSTAKTHHDGFVNLITGLGVPGRDKRQSTMFIPDNRLTYIDLTYLYRNDGLSKRIVDLAVNDMFRSWFTIEGDVEGVIETTLRKLDAKKMLKKAERLSRLFGGSLAVLGINDGRPYDQPVNEASIRSIDHIHVFDRWRITVNTADLYIDPANEKYGMPERYLITPLYGAPFYVHETRVLRFEGTDVTDLVRIQNLGWGDSVLQSCWDRVRALGESYANIETIISEYVMGVMTINGLQEMVVNGKERNASKRLNYVDMTKHTQNTILLDAEEKYDRNTITTTGLEGLMDKIIESLCAVTGYPISLLMGRSQAGLSDAEASQVRFYYDLIHGMQEEDLSPQLTRLVHYINLAEGSSLDDDWFIRFNPLWQPTEKEIISQRLEQAQTDQMYLTNGVLTPEEISVSRFGGDHYSCDSVLSEEHKIMLGLTPDKDPSSEEQQHENATREPKATQEAWESKQQTQDSKKREA